MGQLRAHQPNPIVQLLRPDDGAPGGGSACTRRELRSSSTASKGLQPLAPFPYFHVSQGYAQYAAQRASRDLLRPAAQVRGRVSCRTSRPRRSPRRSPRRLSTSRCRRIVAVAAVAAAAASPPAGGPRPASAPAPVAAPSASARVATHLDALFSEIDSDEMNMLIEGEGRRRSQYRDQRRRRTGADRRPHAVVCV